MSSFDLAIPVVRRHEGGFVNNPADPGGATNFGISLRWLKSQGLLDDLEHLEGDVTHDEVQVIKSMTPDEANGFYKQYWWDAYHYENVIAQAIATKIFDTAVNMGAPRAHRFAQQIVGVVQDGVLGPKSFSEINAYPSLKFISNYQNLMANFYRSLATNPARQQFLQGWLNRAYDRI
jgi:lysozyme family protein